MQLATPLFSWRTNGSESRVSSFLVNRNGYERLHDAGESVKDASHRGGTFRSNATRQVESNSGSDWLGSPSSDEKMSTVERSVSDYGDAIQVLTCAERVAVLNDGVVAIVQLFCEKEQYTIVGSIFFRMSHAAPAAASLCFAGVDGNVSELASTSSIATSKDHSTSENCVVTANGIGFVALCNHGNHVVCVTRDGLIGITRLSPRHASLGEDESGPYVIGGAVMSSTMLSSVCSVAGVPNAPVCVCVGRRYGGEVAVIDTELESVLRLFPLFAVGNAMGSGVSPPYIPTQDSEGSRNPFFMRTLESVTCSHLHAQQLPEDTNTREQSDRKSNEKTGEAFFVLLTDSSTGQVYNLTVFLKSDSRHRTDSIDGGVDGGRTITRRIDTLRLRQVVSLAHAKWGGDLGDSCSADCKTADDLPPPPAATATATGAAEMVQQYTQGFDKLAPYKSHTTLTDVASPVGAELSGCNGLGLNETGAAGTPSNDALYAAVTVGEQVVFIQISSGTAVAYITNTSTSPFVLGVWVDSCPNLPFPNKKFAADDTRDDADADTERDTVKSKIFGVARADGTFSVFCVYLSASGASRQADVLFICEARVGTKYILPCTHVSKADKCQFSASATAKSPIPCGAAFDWTMTFISFRPSRMWSHAALLKGSRNASAFTVLRIASPTTLTSIPVEVYVPLRRTDNFPTTELERQHASKTVLSCGIVTNDGAPAVVTVADSGELELVPLLSRSTRRMIANKMLLSAEESRADVTCFLLVDSEEVLGSTGADPAHAVRHLITGHADGTVVVWESHAEGVGKSSRKTVRLAHTCAVTFLQVLPGGLERFEAAFISASAPGGSLAFHSSKTFEVTRVFQAPQPPLTGAYWDDRGDYLLLTSLGGYGNLWHPPTCRLERLVWMANYEKCPGKSWSSQNILCSKADDTSELLDVEHSELQGVRYYSLMMNLDVFVDHLDLFIREYCENDVKPFPALLQSAVNLVLGPFLDPPVPPPVAVLHSTLGLPLLNEDIQASITQTSRALRLSATHFYAATVVALAFESYQPAAKAAGNFTNYLLGTYMQHATVETANAFPQSVARFAVPMLVSLRDLQRKAAIRVLSAVVRATPPQDLAQIVNVSCDMRVRDDVVAEWCCAGLACSNSGVGVDERDDGSDPCSIGCRVDVAMLSMIEYGDDSSRLLATVAVLSQASRDGIALPQECAQLLKQSVLQIQRRVLTLIAQLTGQSGSSHPNANAKNVDRNRTGNDGRLSDAVARPKELLAEDHQSVSRLRLYLTALGNWWVEVSALMSDSAALLNGLCGVFYGPPGVRWSDNSAMRPLLRFGETVVRSMATSQLSGFLSGTLTSQYDRLPESRRQILNLLCVLVQENPVESFPEIDKMLPFVWRALDPHNPNRQERDVLVPPVTVLLRAMVDNIPTVSFQREWHHLVMGLPSGEVIVYHLKSTTTVAAFYSHTAPIVCVAYSINTTAHDIAVVSSELDCVKIWRASRSYSFIGAVLSATASTTFQLHRCLAIPPPVDAQNIPLEHDRRKLLTDSAVVRSCRLTWLSPRCVELSTPWHHKIQLSLT